MAAVLACGSGAVLSHWSAAALWGLLWPLERAIAVWASTHRRGHEGVHVHWARRLDPRDRTIRDGIPVTTVPRTVLDLAAIGNKPTLERATNQADRGAGSVPGSSPTSVSAIAAGRGWLPSARPPRTSRPRRGAPRAIWRSLSSLYAGSTGFPSQR